MTTVVLDHSLLASAQSFAVGQRWKVLAEEGSSCINMSPWKPTPDVQTAVVLAAVGLPSSGWQRGTEVPPELTRKGLAQG